MLENFGLSMKLGFESHTDEYLDDSAHVNLCIPWNLNLKDPSNRKNRVTCSSSDWDRRSVMDAAIDSGKDATDENYFCESKPATSFIDQDLNITEEKTRIVNEAIHALALEVFQPTHIFRQTEPGAATNLEDLKFKSTVGPNSEQVWEPRVIMLVGIQLGVKHRS